LKPRLQLGYLLPGLSLTHLFTPIIIVPLSGIPQNCGWTGGLCLPDEKYPGLMEIPVWNIQTDSYPDNAFALDPCSTDITKNPIPCDTFALLKDNFDKAYAGNRAPVPMYFHSPWLSEPNTMKDVQKFIKYAASKPNTYFITMRQLMDWMKDPVGVDGIGAWLGCGVPGGKAAKGEGGVTGSIAGVTAAIDVADVTTAPAPGPAAGVVNPAATVADVIVPAAGPAPTVAIPAATEAIVPAATEMIAPAAVTDVTIPPAVLAEGNGGHMAAATLVGMLFVGVLVL
jgi:hypothetical protein